MNCPVCNHENEEGALVCASCGAALSQPATEEISPEIVTEDAAEPVAEPVEEVAAEAQAAWESAIEAAPVRRSTPWAWIAAALVLVGVIVAAVLFLPKMIGLSGEKPLVYGLLGDTLETGFNGLYRVEENGSGNRQLAAGLERLLVPIQVPGLERSAYSASGEHVVLHSLGAEEPAITEAYVLPLDGSDVAARLTDATLYGMYESFSPDGKLFAGTVVVTDDQQMRHPNVLVQDMSGKELLNVPDAFLVSFTADSKTILAISLDPADNSGSIISVAVADGTQTVLVEEAGSNTPLIAPDGKSFFYLNDTGETPGLYRVAIASGESSLFYAPEGETTLIGMIGLSTDGKQIMSYETDPSQAAGPSLTLVDVASGKAAALDTNLNSNALSPYLGWQSSPAVFSADGKWLAYQVAGETFPELRVSQIDGQGKATLTAAGEYPQFDFTANGKQVVYIVGTALGEGNSVWTGDLYVSGLDGQNPVKLDSNVSSFRLGGSGQVIYFRYDSEAKNSTLLSIGLDGQGQKELLAAQAGLAVMVR